MAEMNLCFQNERRVHLLLRVYPFNKYCREIGAKLYREAADIEDPRSMLYLLGILLRYTKV